MILTATDFGYEGPYMGQLRAACLAVAPEVPVMDLCVDLPAFNPRYAAYLLAAWAPPMARAYVLLGIVDPGVGGDRNAVIARIGDAYCVGPDNGLFGPLAQQRGEVGWWRIDWRPKHLSHSFHGRDLFAPVAAHLALGKPPEHFGPPATPVDIGDWPNDLDRVLHIDRYGNAVTGRRAQTLRPEVRLRVSGIDIPPVRTFSDTEPGMVFWYENSSGLVEIAAREASAARTLTLRCGTRIRPEVS